MLLVRDVMTPKVKTTNPETTIRVAAGLMLKAKIGSLLILEGGTLLGAVTEGDVSRAIAKGADPDKAVVREVMSKMLVTIDPSARMEEAAKKMAGAKVKRLPVLEDGKVVGIITQTDIVAWSFDLVTSLKEMVRARYRPPDFQP
ncbi:MAG: CBS domain-containing protein [Thaumarchaeota archaeon]|nr:CBS domain-containing protein [Nitrososphaerota archaeon]